MTADAEANTSNLNVKLSASFPDSEIFGVKLVNGHSTQAIVSLDNQEQRTISLQIVGGSLWTPDYGDAEGAEPSRIVRNLTTQVYRASVPAGEKETFQYNFALEMHPADLELRLIGILSTDENAFFTKEVYRGAVSVVEAPTSFFDPKMYAQALFLYVESRLTHATASSSTSFWAPHSLALRTSSTALGSPRCSRSRSAAPALPTPLSPSPLHRPRRLPRLAMLRPLRRLPAPRCTMRAGSRSSTSSNRARSAFAAARLLASRPRRPFDRVRENPDRWVGLDEASTCWI